MRRRRVDARRCRFAVLVLAVLLPVVADAVQPSPVAAVTTGEYSGPAWFPLRGTWVIGCTWSNGCTDGYHGYFALDIARNSSGSIAGDPIYAAGKGQVEFAQSGQGGNCSPDIYASPSACPNGSKGNGVQISHGGTVKSLYWHMSSVAVVAGQWVDENTVIGYVGSSGYSRPGFNHLHYEKWANGLRADPGTLKACHSSTAVSYPATVAAGITSWSQVPRWSQVASDGVACGLPTAFTEGQFTGIQGGPRNGTVARVVGGHLIGIGDCAALSNCPGVVWVDQATYEKYDVTHPNIADSTFIGIQGGPRNGTVARAVGGHLIGIGDCSVLASCAGVIWVDQTGFEQYAAQHVLVWDSAFVGIQGGPRNGTVARVVGGHLIGIGNCAALFNCPGVVWVDQTGFEQYDSAHPAIADHSFIGIQGGPRNGTVARVAGGHLLGIANCSVLSLCAGVVWVDQTGYEQYDVEHPTIRNGTILVGLPSNTAWSVVGGKRSMSSTRLGAVLVDDNALTFVPKAPPGRPTGVAGTPSSARVSLTWPSAAPGGAPISDYIVQFSSNSGATWTTFADGVKGTTGATVTGLVNGRQYRFRVAAKNVAGVGLFSTASAAITPRTRPARPAAPTPTAGTKRVSLSWTAPANGGAPIVDYVIQYSINSGLTWSTFPDGIKATPGATVTGLLTGRRYTFRIAARNAAGLGAFSAASIGSSPL